MDKRLKDKGAGKIPLTVIFRKDELDGGYIAECLELPGCMSQGETEDEARANIEDAIKACIAVVLSDRIESTMRELQPTAPGKSEDEKRETFWMATDLEEVCA